MSNLGRRLKGAREKTRLTQQQVADKLGISNGTLSGYERNYRDPDTVTLNNLAALYEVSVDYLLGRTEDPKRVLKEQSRRLIDMIDLDLTDEEIMSKMDLYVDGQIVEEKEVRIFIDLVRGSRLRMKQGLSSTENKQ